VVTAVDYLITDGHGEDCPAQSDGLSHCYREVTDNEAGQRVNADYCAGCQRFVACVNTCKQLQAERLLAEKSVAAEIARRKSEDARWRRACRRTLALQVAIVAVVTVIVLVIVI
jgi:Pyruvate/2-oxoacid:ferredoxin oxidoreductase delta subunit